MQNLVFNNLLVGAHKSIVGCKIHNSGGSDCASVKALSSGYRLEWFCPLAIYL